MNSPAENIGVLNFRARVIDLLRQVIDPELGINIIDMGLVYSVEISDMAKEIVVVMTLSTKGCPMGAAISGGVENILRSSFSDYSLLVDLVWEPAWSPEFISADGRQQLEL